jgi:hypothetical protein
VYGLLVAFSVALFLFWGGPLWTASREASHVGRFAFSYMLVLPAAALLLLAARRFSWSHLACATGSAWGIKLVITSALYFSLARGTAHLPTAAVTTSSARGKTAFVADYAPAKGEFPRGTLTGSVLQGNMPVAGAVVFIDRPRPGLALSAEAPPFKMTIAGSRYGGLVYVGRTDGAFEIESRDPVLHTLHLYELGRGSAASGSAASERAVMNVPVPAGGAPRPFPAPEPGAYEARCDTHPTERASVVIADHPYVARTGEEGQFTLAGVPEGPLALVVVARESGESLAGEIQNTKSVVRHVPARVEASETTVVHIDLSTPEAAEERL